MKKTLPASVCLIVFFASCMRYQYVSINSPTIPMNEYNEFVAENDSLRLLYYFNKEDASVNLTIQNKLNVPVFIDWQRSSMIVNDKAFGYAPNSFKIEGNYRGSSYNDSTFSNYGYGDRYDNIHATGTFPEKSDFIPPRSYVTKKSICLIQRFISNVPPSAWHMDVVDGFPGRVKTASFDDYSSPLRFRTFITTMVGEASAQPVTFEHEFYVAGLVNTGRWLPGACRGNQFIMKDATGFAGGFIIAGVLTVAAVKMMADRKAKELN